MLAVCGSLLHVMSSQHSVGAGRCCRAREPRPHQAVAHDSAGRRGGGATVSPRIAPVHACRGGSPSTDGPVRVVTLLSGSGELSRIVWRVRAWAKVSVFGVSASSLFGHITKVSKATHTYSTFTRIYEDAPRRGAPRVGWRRDRWRGQWPRHARGEHRTSASIYVTHLCGSCIVVAHNYP